MNARLDEARQLIQAATRDKISLELLVESGRAPNETIGFLAQQACEKSIKAVLVLHNVALERTHDLEYLAELAFANNLLLPQPKSVLRRLNPYAVALRYEGSNVTWVSDLEAKETAHSVFTWANDLISQL